MKTNCHLHFLESSLSQRVEKRPNLNTTVLERMSPNSAVENLDYKVANLQQKLNLLKYKKKVQFCLKRLKKILTLIGENGISRGASQGNGEYTWNKKE